ncbi:MAG TPA: HAMP domain-containing sensor histidine kinase [Chitinophagaceae bacterium]|nr:HAMP domain-containing sensor histidine kinase [Chitinophagaceae bacterium]
MRVDKLSAISQKKATAFMDERSELQEDKEKAIVAIVHEIRNPLTAIKITNQLMQEAFDKQERDQLLMQSYMMIIAQNIGRIEKHLKEALTYKKRNTILEPVNVCDCLDKAVCLAQDRIYLAGIDLNNNYTGDHLVYGQEEKLTTAFLNIIINAIEAIKTGKGKIWISVYETNNTVRITIKDNGCGIEPGVAEKIFDPCFSTKDGIGIGLSNVKEIMNLHKAHIVADSLPGVGTSISILFNSIPQDDIAKSKSVKDSLHSTH